MWQPALPPSMVLACGDSLLNRVSQQLNADWSKEVCLGNQNENASLTFLLMLGQEGTGHSEVTILG